MPIYRPSELHQFLHELGVSPKKRLSQNFLIDGNVIRKIVSSAEISPEDVILEIGSGPGCLSEEILLMKNIKLLAVEKDPLLAQALKRLKKASSSLEIFCEDILNFPIEQKLNDSLKPGRKAIILGNLPYHLTTPILVKLVPLHLQVSRIIIMVQEEVARRFTAMPGTSEYSSITLFLNYYSTPRYLFTVRKTCFYPIPKVDSAVVALDLHPSPQVTDQTKFFEMIRTAFGHRRKMLRSSLKGLYSMEIITQALTTIGYDTRTRPEELSLDKFIQLFEILHLASKKNF